MTDISTQEREAQLRKMERTVMEKVSMTKIAGFILVHAGYGNGLKID